MPLDQRMAGFDNDGTLWCEQPVPFQKNGELIGAAAATGDWSGT